MRFKDNEEEVLIRDTVGRVLTDNWDRSRSNSATVAEVLASPVETQLSKLGISGAWLPEDAGGAGGGPRALMEFAEQVGRHQYPSGYLSSSVMSAHLLGRAEGDPAAHLLRRIAAGETRVSTALFEPGRRYDLTPEATAVSEGDRLVLSGSKAHVLDGPLADAFLIPVRRGSETAICLVPAEAEGLSVAAYDGVGGTPFCRLDLDGVELGPEADLLGGNLAQAALSEAVTLARFAAAAEILGVCEAAFLETLDYLRLREQFGRTLNRFQALQHRASDLYVELEMLRSLVIGAAIALEDRGPGAARTDVLAALSYAIPTGDLIGREAIQMHGAIGMTRDLGIGRFLMRANVLSKVFGDLAQIEGELADAIEAPR